MKRSLSLFLTLLVLAPLAWGQSGRNVSFGEVRSAGADAGPLRPVDAPAVRVFPALRAGSDAATWAGRMEGLASAAVSGKSQGGLLKLDAEARLLLMTRDALGKNSTGLLGLLPEVSVHASGGAVVINVLAEMAAGASTAHIEALGATVQTRVGTIVALGVPLDALAQVAARPEVLRVETSKQRRLSMLASRAEIRADLVHNGVGLPGPVQGENVVVGVLDSGLDVTHPDFFNEGGSRVQYLLEFQNGGTQAEWTKAQIDADPAAVSERDGNGGHGHGTHVTGTAAGGGRTDASLRGIAPRSDIIFVKGIRDPDSNGGFADNDVLAGVQYIFSKAAALGKPAVINLSLGGNGGPLDGTSLQDRALSDLVGPGRIIVAAGGNEGFDLIHAGGNHVPGLITQAMLMPAGAGQARADLWYAPGSVAEVGLAAYFVENGTLKLANFSGWLPVGNSFANWEPFTVDGQKVAEFAIDAATTQDPGSGDGNVYVVIRGNENLNPSQWIWGVVTRGPQAGRLDLWTQGAEVVPFTFGLAGYNELPGNTDQTVGSPASAQRIIAVGSYVTTNTWTSIDGNRYEWRNPNPNRQGAPVVPALGQRSYFSSVGPTRDGRVKPSIAAPGEFIFSTRSSHLTEGVGMDRSEVLPGGWHVGMQGTSMASPHIAGVVALMLQVNPSLNYEDALDILQQTARTDVQTGAVPNTQWGAGRVDALAAVQESLRRAGGNPGGGLQQATLSLFDPAGQQRNPALDAVLPVDTGFVAGMNLYGDRAKATAFSLPTNTTSAEVTAVNVWFGFKKPATARTYAIEVYSGTPQSGPTGTPLYRQEFAFSHALADADFSTAEAPTVHAFARPVQVNGPFYVSVDFGAYSPAEAGALSIVTTNLAQGRVGRTWEMTQNGGWIALSDSWNFGSGTGAHDLDLWIQAAIRYATSTPVDTDQNPSALRLHLAGPNPFRDATMLAYGVPQSGPVSLEVFDLLGRRVATLVDGVQPTGTYTVPFAPEALSSGLYLARITAAGQSRTLYLTHID